jgi:carboxyl-terminal processing protease
MKRLFLNTRNRILLALLLLAGGFLAGYRENDKYFEIAKNLDIFAAVFRNLNTYYVDSIEPARLMGTGIDAMVESLDPYTTYYPENNLDELDFQTTGKYGGVGLSVRQIHDSTVVSDIYGGSPVDRAGIRAGDIIVSIDGHNAKDLSDEQISRLLKGEPGTSLQMVLKNPVTGAITAKTITRQEIDIRSVSYAGMAGQGIGYVKLNQFTEFSANEVSATMDSLMRSNPGMKGIIVDLRSNPGGLLDEAVKLSSLFIGQGQIVVSTKGKATGWNRDYTTGVIAKYPSIPLVVLTNRLSASASEIYAGAVQDLDRGIIIGQRSFGKGLVQTTRDLPYNSKLKVTVAKYYTPSGRCIQAIDYAHRNDEGTVQYIPDSLRKSFRTKHGRTVMDGGGIEPDVHLAPEYLSNIALTLLSKNYIFEYATQYYYTHPDSRLSPKDFSITEDDYSDFLTFISGKNYDYRTRSKDALDELEKAAEKENYMGDVKPQLEALKKQLLLEKQNDLIRHKTELENLLDQEIIGRYYLMNGRIARSLAFDEDVIKAKSILNDTAKYNGIISGRITEPPMATPAYQQE